MPMEPPWINGNRGQMDNASPDNSEMHFIRLLAGPAPRCILVLISLPLVSFSLPCFGTLGTTSQINYLHMTLSWALL